MKEAIIVKLVQMVLKLAMPYLRKKAAESHSKVDDVLVEILAKLTGPTTTPQGAKE